MLSMGKSETLTKKKTKRFCCRDNNFLLNQILPGLMITCRNFGPSRRGLPVRAPTNTSNNRTTLQRACPTTTSQRTAHGMMSVSRCHRYRRTEPSTVAAYGQPQHGPIPRAGSTDRGTRPAEAPPVWASERNVK